MNVTRKDFDAAAAKMGMTPVVRLYSSDDRDAVLALWLASNISRPWLDLGLEIDEMIRHDRSLFLVAEQGGSVIGAVMGGYDGRRGWIYHLAVNPDYRRRGTGRLLIEDLERRMRDRGVAKINLQIRADKVAVTDFYVQLGYQDEHLTSMGKRLQ